LKVRKYLLAATPFFLCAFLALKQVSVELNGGPGAAYAHGAEGLLSYLSDHWLNVGLVLSGVFLFLTFVEDIYDRAKGFLAHRRLSKRFKKWDKP
jgi:hypothetical protein